MTTTTPWQVKKGQHADEQRALPEEGQQPAVCVGLIDLGTHTQDYEGEEKSFRKVAIVWELTDAPDPALKSGNFVILRDYTVAWSANANLKKLIHKWFGKAPPEEGFDLQLLIDPRYSKCVANIVHGTSQNNREYAKLEDVAKPHKSLEIPRARRQPFIWNLTDDLSDIPKWVPFLYGESVATVIKKSQEYREQFRKKPATPGKDNDNPIDPGLGDTDAGDNPFPEENIPF